MGVSTKTRSITTLAAVALVLTHGVAAIAAAPPRPKHFDIPPRTEWKPQGCRTVPASNAVTGSGDAWRFLHADAASTDEVSIAAAPLFEADWQAEPTTFNVTVPTFDRQGNLYFSPLWPYENTVLISLDPATGAKRWAIPGTGAPSGGIAPMVLNDPANPGQEIVYQTFYDRALAVRTDGTIVWDVPTGLTLTGVAKHDAVLGNSYLPQLDAIVGLSGDGHIYVLDRENGTPLLNAPYSLPGLGSPAGLGLALPQTVIDTVEADLTQFLNFPPGSSLESFLAVILGNEIEVANSFSIDANSGRIWVAATAPDGDDGTVDGVSELGALYGLDLVQNGGGYDMSVACYYSFPGGSASTPGLRTDGTRAYIGDNFGNLIAVDSSCNQAWSVPVGSQITGSVAVSSDNNELYVSTQTDVLQVFDEGTTASFGWTADLDVFSPGAANQDNFNMLLAGIAANGVNVMVGAGIPPGQLANIGLPMTVGYGLLDRATGNMRYFTPGLDESVAEMNVAPDGSYYNSNSPVRRAFTHAIYPALTAPIEGGVRKFKAKHVDLLVRDIVCAAADRAANAAAVEGTCPASSGADAVQIQSLISQARRVAPSAIAANNLSQAMWARIDADLTTAGNVLLAGAATALQHACRTIAPCPSAPMPACRSAGASKLTMKTDTEKVPNADKLKWSWSRGQATDAAELGDPASNADYGLCVYAGAPGTETLVYEAGLPASAELWRVKSSGIAFVDKGRTARGLKSFRAKPGSEASMKASAKAAELSSNSFPLATPVTVQAVNGSTGLCWEGRFDAADIAKSDAFRFSAKKP